MHTRNLWMSLCVWLTKIVCSDWTKLIAIVCGREGEILKVIVRWVDWSKLWVKPTEKYISAMQQAL
jgi:hypothetical protein